MLIFKIEMYNGTFWSTDLCQLNGPIAIFLMRKSSKFTEFTFINYAFKL